MKLGGGRKGIKFFPGEQKSAFPSFESRGSCGEDPRRLDKRLRGGKLFVTKVELHRSIEAKEARKCAKNVVIRDQHLITIIARERERCERALSEVETEMSSNDISSFPFSLLIRLPVYLYIIRFATTHA